MGSHGTPFGTPPGTPMGLKFFWGLVILICIPPTRNQARNMAKTPILNFYTPLLMSETTVQCMRGLKKIHLHCKMSLRHGSPP